MGKRFTPDKPILIYKLTCLLNDKAYIGQTHNTLRQRWNGHVSCAKNGSRFPIHCAIRKHGVQNFSKEVLCETTNAKADLEHSKKTKQLMSEVHAGRVHTKVWRNRISLTLQGHSVSEETKSKISTALTKSWKNKKKKEVA